MRYSVIIHKDPDSAYGVTVPDLPGCFSLGETVEDALKHAAEAIECYLEDLLLDGELIPAPKIFGFQPTHSDYSEGVWETVSVDLSALNSIKLV